MGLGDILEQQSTNQFIEKAKNQFQKYKKSAQPKKQKLNKWSLNKKKIKIWELSDKDLRDLFIKFVGFVGYYSSEISSIDGLGYAILNPKGDTHRGDANPEPVDDITDDYMGITPFQADAIIDYRNNVNILNIWPRAHGKSWKTEWITELCMKYEADKFLYFSLTDAAYRASNEIYIWAQNNNAVVDSETVKVVKKVSGKRSSYQKFTLINGAQFEVHGIRTSSTLGYHGWILIFDDIIDETDNYLQKRLQRKLNSQYFKIRRKKLVIDNTRKFPGDIFDFILDQFENKQKAYIAKKGSISSKYTLFVSHLTPYADLQYKGGIGGYRGFLKQFEKQQITYDIDKIIAPWHVPPDFEIMRLENLSSFNSEMMGNPQELEGRMVNSGDIFYTNRPHFSQSVQMGGTGVDSANTEDENNDYCAVVSCVMHSHIIDKIVHKRFTIYKSNVERILARNKIVENEGDPYDWRNDKGQKVKRGLIETVQEHCEYYLLQYPNKPYIVAMERNNAGIAYMEQALHMYRNHEKVEIRRGVFVVLTWPRFLVEDPNQAIKLKKRGKTNIRLGVTHVREKVTRIYSEIKYSIETHETRFTFDQEDTLGLAQLRVYPRGKHDDFPDATGMIKDELDRRWNKPVGIRKPRQAIKEEKVVEKAAEAHKLAGMPWMSNKYEQRKMQGRTRRGRRI